MANCEQLHETVIRDIIDVIMDTKNSETLRGVFNKDVNFKSIANASSNLTLVFPVLVSRSLKIENSAMVSKAIERKAVAMLQMLFSAISVTNGDARDYLSKFHTNLNFDSDLSIDQFIDVLDKYVVEHESAGTIKITDRDLYNVVKEDLKNLNHYVPELISEVSINDYKVLPETYGENNIILSERDHSDIKNLNDIFKTQVLTSDIKKANELVPTTMTVNFVSTATGQPIGSIFVIGIKAKMYIIESNDIIDRIISKNKDGNGLNKFIRATTREISFWKDFVFAVDKAKLDALSSSGRGSSSKIWKLLERRALKSRIRRFIGNNNDAVAITSLVISQDEVEYLKKNENIDLEKPQVVKSILDAYNLIAFVIVDEAMEIVKFLYDDGNNMYETLTFNHLERDTADGGYKKVINLMTKMSR